MGVKDVWSKAKEKAGKLIEKGNEELKKMTGTKAVVLYSKPVFGGFVSKRAFYEGDELWFPVADFDKEDIEANAIIGLDEDEEYYIISEITFDSVQKEIVKDDKVFSYECYVVKYQILNDYFTDEVEGLPFHDLTKQQSEILKEIRQKIENKSLAMKDKKEFCLNLWHFFQECIQYQLKAHPVVITFSRIASEYIDNYSDYLIKLFS